MEWQFIVAIVVAIPFILIPVVFVWYLNIGGIIAAIRQGQKERRTAREEARAMAKERPTVTWTVAQERPAVAGAVPQEQPAAAAAVLQERPAVAVAEAEKQPAAAVVGEAEKLIAKRRLRGTRR